MFRIRPIFDDTTPANRDTIQQIQRIMRTQFHELDEETITKLPDELRDPLKYQLKSMLFVADDSRGKVKGFALLHHAPDLHFCYLDFISAAPKSTGRGIGGAIYDRIRETVRQLDIQGLFFECLPDDSRLCRNPVALKQNAARLRFYERYGAFPIINTAYETPVLENSDCPPYLVYDDLGNGKPLRKSNTKKIVRAILERKYGDVCDPEYINSVVDSFQDDPVQLRPPRYIKTKLINVSQNTHKESKIILVLNDQHDIHHVHERGYVESPVRIKTIMKELETTGLFTQICIEHFPEKHILAIHDRAFVKYLKKVCANVVDKKSIYPYVFPIRNTARPPKELPVRAGYYCIDTFTPLNQNAFRSATRAVDSALTAASSILAGHSLAYALVRPPGHHAEWSSFGGFCYFNSNAAAAQYLSYYGRVAILDVDYHHGNGQQDIFYQRSDILTVSIHGHPSFAFPYFSGFSDERGYGKGLDYNINYPLQEHLTGPQHYKVLEKALNRIRKFKPDFLIIALGLDTAKGDPTGSWHLTADDFEKNGQLIGSMRMPTLVVQEGGYRIRSLGVNARRFFIGLWKGMNPNED